MKSPFHRSERNGPGEQAAKWLTLLAEGGPEVREGFVSWLKQSPQNVEEFLFASATWETFAGRTPANADEIDRIVAQALEAKTPENVVQWTSEIPEAEPEEVPGTNAAPAGAVDAGTRTSHAIRWAAAILITVGLVAAGWWNRGEIVAFARPGSYATAVGEQRTIRLSDGSVVFLNARSRLEVKFSEEGRDLRLVAGEAIFKVAREAHRPFRVRTQDALVQALGTEFNVYRRNDGTTVSVLDGRVRVSSNSTTQTEDPHHAAPRADGVSLGAGEEVRMAPGGKLQKRAEPDVVATVAWRQRRLVFRAERLEDISREFSRYSPRTIELSDDVARNTRITGTFDVDDPDSLVQFLEELDGISVAHAGNRFVVRGDTVRRPDVEPRG